VTLLPGPIDVHQHLAFDASCDPVAQLDADDDATLLLRMRLAAQRALAVGITTIRDLATEATCLWRSETGSSSATRSARALSRRAVQSPRPAGTAGSSVARSTAPKAFAKQRENEWLAVQTSSR
jgi:imidazolonepropionase-like amidohydrolase